MSIRKFRQELIEADPEGRKPLRLPGTSGYTSPQRPNSVADRRNRNRLSLHAQRVLWLSKATNVSPSDVTQVLTQYLWLLREEALRLGVASLPGLGEIRHHFLACPPNKRGWRWKQQVMWEWDRGLVWMMAARGKAICKEEAKAGWEREGKPRPKNVTPRFKKFSVAGLLPLPSLITWRRKIGIREVSAEVHREALVEVEPWEGTLYDLIKHSSAQEAEAILEIRAREPLPLPPGACLGQPRWDSAGRPRTKPVETSSVAWKEDAPSGASSGSAPEGEPEAQPLPEKPPEG